MNDHRPKTVMMPIMQSSGGPYWVRGPSAQGRSHHRAMHKPARASAAAAPNAPRERIPPIWSKRFESAPGVLNRQ
jgi:hypothetical protein